MRRGLAPLLHWGAAQDDAAWERAEELLRDSLTSDQYAQYADRGFLEMPSSIVPGRVYRIDGWRPIAVFEDGQFVGALCLRPREHLPGPDVVLARKLLVEGAEDELLEKGNWLRPTPRPASALPPLFLIVILMSPWLLALFRWGPAGVAIGSALLALPVALTALAWRRRPRPRSGGA